MAEQTGREEIRQHLIAEHYWPQLARYDASEKDLRELHDMMHDPDVPLARTVDRLRAILAMPPSDPED
jgi:hypothetical protein